MTITAEELEDALDYLDASTLDQLGSLLRERARFRRVTEAEAPQPVDWLALSIRERLRLTAEGFRSWGAPDDLIAVDLARKLLERGYSAQDAADLLNDVGITWKPSTDESRLVKVANGMYMDGWSEPQVRWAIQGLTG
jgi:hypothetical protein